MDIDADARRRFHEEFDVHAYEDESDLYEDCDAVLITTPNRFHEQYAVSALEAGLDVLLEKLAGAPSVVESGAHRRGRPRR